MYILECSDNSFYVGSTTNLLKRFKQHQNGEGANYTKKRLPVKLVYFEKYKRIQDAYKRERQIHGWSHKKKEALIKNNICDLKWLAECRNETHYKYHIGYVIRK